MNTVRWSPTTAQRCKTSPGTIVLGSPGYGKTFAMQNFAANILGLGQRVIVIDPKNDFAKIKRIDPRVKVIDLKMVTPGALNPFEFLKCHTLKNGVPTVTEVDAPTIISLLQILCGKEIFNAEVKTQTEPVVLDYIKECDKTGKPKTLASLREFLAFSNQPLAKQTGNLLSTYTEPNFLIGQLLFASEDDVKPLEISNKDSIVISLEGLELPSYDKKPEDYTNIEKFTSALVFVLVNKLNNILVKEEKVESNENNIYGERLNKVPILFICDEAHVLFSNTTMTTTIQNFLRQGRSLGVSTMLASQGISHFPKDIANYMSTKFIFHSSNDEAEAFMKIFNKGLAQSIDYNCTVNSIAGLRQGQCFMIDRFGRTGYVQITSSWDSRIFSEDLRHDEI